MNDGPGVRNLRSQQRLSAKDCGQKSAVTRGVVARSTRIEQRPGSLMKEPGRCGSLLDAADAVAAVAPTVDAPSAISGRSVAGFHFQHDCLLEFRSQTWRVPRITSHETRILSHYFRINNAQFEQGHCRIEPCCLRGIETCMRISRELPCLKTVIFDLANSLLVSSC